MKKSLLWLSALAAGAMFSQSAVAVTPVPVSFSGSYNYSFNSLGSVSGTVTLPAGWYEYKSEATPVWVGTASSLGSNQTTFNGGTYLFVSSATQGGAGAAEALGGVATTSAGSDIGIMLALTNTTGGDLNSVSLSFDVTQFKQNTAAQTLQFGYSTSAATKINAYTFDSNFTYTTPDVGTAGLVNVTTNINGTLSLGSTWAAGTTLYLEWYLPVATAAGIPVGISDVTITAAAVPEPSTWLLLGLGAVVLLVSTGRTAGRRAA